MAFLKSMQDLASLAALPGMVLSLLSRIININFQLRIVSKKRHQKTVWKTCVSGPFAWGK
jgi:hypothetical protein